MRNFTRAGLFSLFIMLCSCIHKDSDLEPCEPVTPPENGRLRIEFDWIDTEPQSPDEIIPIRVTSSHGETQVFNSGISGIDVDLNPDVYHLVASEPSGNVTVEGTIASIGTTSNGYLREPFAFNAGYTSAQVYSRENDQVILLPMYRQTRPLIIRIWFTGSGVSLLENVEGLLSGVSMARDLAYGFPPADPEIQRPPAIGNGTVSYTFQQQDDGWIQGDNRLLGIDGDAQQRLNLRVMLVTENFREVFLDVTEALDGFHTIDVTDPYYIILVVNIDANFDMSIQDWAYGSDQWIIAE